MCGRARPGAKLTDRPVALTEKPVDKSPGTDTTNDASLRRPCPCESGECDTLEMQQVIHNPSGPVLLANNLKNMNLHSIRGQHCTFLTAPTAKTKDLKDNVYRGSTPDDRKGPRS